MDEGGGSREVGRRRIMDKHCVDKEVRPRTLAKSNRSGEEDRIEIIECKWGAVPVDTGREYT